MWLQKNALLKPKWLSSFNVLSSESHFVNQYFVIRLHRRSIEHLSPQPIHVACCVFSINCRPRENSYRWSKKMKFLSILFTLTVLALSPVQASTTDATSLMGEPGKQQSTIDYAPHPRVSAHAIVLFEPNENSNLMMPSRTERRLNGHVITNIRQIVSDDQIIFPPDSFTMSLEKGVKVRIYLMRYENRNAFYPIAIFPESYPEETR